MNSRRKLLSSLGVAALAMGFATGAVAQAADSSDWPNRPIVLVNPFPAGSATDVVARLLAGKMTQNMGQSVVVENRTGASGNIGTSHVARSKADGYTLLLGSTGTMMINPWVFAKLPYDPLKDFDPVAHVASFPQVVIANPNQPFKTIPELIAAARAQPDSLAHGSSGQGTTSHLVMEMIKADADLKMMHVAYRGGAPTVQAVMSGEIQTGVEGLPPLVGQIKAGRVTPLAVTSAQRSSQLPDVPAMSEFLPGFEAIIAILFMAPAGTPPDIVAKISAEAKRAAEDPEVRAQLETMGAVVIGSSPAETGAFHREQLKKFQRAVELASIRPE